MTSIDPDMSENVLKGKLKLSLISRRVKVITRPVGVAGPGGDGAAAKLKKPSTVKRTKLISTIFMFMMF